MKYKLLQRLLLGILILLTLYYRVSATAGTENEWVPFTVYSPESRVLYPTTEEPGSFLSNCSVFLNITEFTGDTRLRIFADVRDEPGALQIHFTSAPGHYILNFTSCNMIWTFTTDNDVAYSIRGNYQIIHHTLNASQTIVSWQPLILKGPHYLSIIPSEDGYQFDATVKFRIDLNNGTITLSYMPASADVDEYMKITTTGIFSYDYDDISYLELYHDVPRGTAFGDYPEAAYFIAKGQYRITGFQREAAIPPLFIFFVLAYVVLGGATMGCGVFLISWYRNRVRLPSKQGKNVNVGWIGMAVLGLLFLGLAAIWLFYTTFWLEFLIRYFRTI